MTTRDRLRRYGPLATVVLAVMVLFVALTGTAASQDAAFREEGVTFTSDDTHLAGSILIPNDPGPRPGLVLIHGAGSHDRDSLRLEAEEFARRGIVTLIYDKRRDGYSDFERSYTQLAGDAVAAIAVLASHPAVNDDALGLWGVSEGAWVAPLAARDPAMTDQIDFLVLVAPTGVSPARQHGWYLEGRLRAAGIEGSLIDSLVHREMRFLISVGLFAEAFHDPVTPLRDIEQPVLAMWGADDDIEPPAESIQIVASTLRQSGNRQVELAVLAGAGHDLRLEGSLVPGYADKVAEFVGTVADGTLVDAPPDPPIPDQTHPSRPHPPLRWWESGWLHLGLAATLIVAFVATWFRARHLSSTAGWVRLASALGAVTVIGTTVYLAYLLSTDVASVGPTLGNRAVVWLALQAGAVIALAGTVVPAVGQIRARSGPRAISLLVPGLLFAVWAGYWGLLTV